MNQSTESSEPTFTVAEEHAPITARSGSGVTDGGDRSGASRRANGHATVHATPLGEHPVERGFFTDGEVGRYLGGPEEFGDAGSFSETMAERPASTLQRWTSLAVVVAVAGAVAGGTVVATGWLDSWLGKGRRAELAAVGVAAAKQQSNASSGEAESSAAEADPTTGASAEVSLPGTPAAAIEPAVPTNTPEVAASSTAASSTALVDPALLDQAPIPSATEQPGTPAAAAPEPPVPPVEAATGADSTAASLAPQAHAASSRQQPAPPKTRAEASPPRVRSAAIATPRPASPSVKKSFAPSPAKAPAAPATPATPAPAKKPAVVSFPTN